MDLNQYMSLQESDEVVLDRSTASADAETDRPLSGDELLVREGSEQQPTLSVVMPTLNEEEGIGECIRRIKNALEELQIYGEIVRRSDPWPPCSVRTVPTRTTSSIKEFGGAGRLSDIGLTDRHGPSHGFNRRMRVCPLDRPVGSTVSLPRHGSDVEDDYGVRVA